MPAAKRTRKGLAGTRRRLHDEGEEDDGAPDLNSDSQSEGSSATDVDDAGSSNASDTEEPEEQDSRVQVTAGTVENTHPVTDVSGSIADSTGKKLAGRADGVTTFKTTAETDAMLHGLTLEKGAQDEDAIHFEDSAGTVTVKDLDTQKAVPAFSQPEKKRETLVGRRSREHEEYNQKRQVDPAFVPNRGGFFMHDQRNSNFGTSGQPPLGRGRGRDGPHAIIGAMRPQPQAPRPAMERWAHDLHETVVNPRVPDSRPQPSHPSQPVNRPQNTVDIEPPSKSTAIGTVTIKIALSNGKPSGKPLKMTVRQHTRLPDLRPPLRRDKPVRVFVPGQSARYVFPNPDRSFIFMPRSQYMKQPPAGPQARVVPQQTGGRRQSTFATSTYATSSASRRSSILQDKSDVTSQPSAQPPTSNVAPSAPYMDNALVSPVFMQGQSHPPPAQPLRQEARRLSLPMHQPRPQKQVSLATIDSPSTMQAPQSQEQAPFHQQVPPNVNGTSSSEPMTNRQQSLQGQQYPVVTPLSVIPEVAANAQSFHPGMAAPQGYYPPQYPAQPMYYYPQSSGASHGQYHVPPYGADAPYYMPFFGQSQAEMPDMGDSSAAGQYAHESNGMVYYYDPDVAANEAQMYNFSQPTAGEGFYYGQDQMSNQMYYPIQ